MCSFNIETPLLLIFEPLLPVCLGMTGHRTVDISHITANIHVVLSIACTNWVFAQYFSPEQGFH
jgi:hypothetical protein